MFKKIKEFFVGKPVEAPVESAPYKVPEPAATTPIPLVPVVEAAPVMDQVAVVNAAEGSAITAAPEKKARKPRAPKAEVAVKEKAPAKAKAPKLTVIKAKSKKA
jgi:hypothetical protein